VHAKSGLCAQVTGFMCVLERSLCAQESKTYKWNQKIMYVVVFRCSVWLCMHSSVRMFGVVLHSVMSVCSVCLSIQFYFKLLSLL
jgi:hypothetical protein